MKNPYEVLGVPKDASEETIRSAYRKLALQYHPDRCPGDAEAEVKFREIQSAYEVLSNREKRQEYDTYGGQRPFPANGFEDIFGSFFSFGQGQRRREPSLRHVQVEVELTFMEAALGCKKEVGVERYDHCGDCEGTGAKGGTAFEQCSQCKGHGKIFAKQSFIQLAQTCPRCMGRGRVVTEKCEACFGRGSKAKPTTLEVVIPQGAFDGMRMCIKGEGEMDGNGARGDLYVILSVMPHEYFARNEETLLLSVPVPYSLAVLGGTLEVPGLNGTLTVNVPPGTQSGTLLRLRKQGFMDPYAPGERGDYLVQVNIDTPNLDGNENYISLIRQLAELEEKHKSVRRADYEAKVKKG